LLEEQGRTVAPVPLWSTVVAALAIAEHGSPSQRSQWLPGVANGDVMLAVAISESGSNDGACRVRDAGEGRLSGTKLSVPGAPVAARVVVTAADPNGKPALYLVDPNGDGVEQRRVTTTNREPQAHLVFDGAVGERLGSSDQAAPWLIDRAVVGL